MEISAACIDLFKRNAAEAFGGRFHVPCIDEYPCLFSWDSGYHALALQHLDRSAALEELRTLYRANTTEDGLLAHERPLPEAVERTQLIVETIGPIYRPDLRSWLIDPPVAAYAVGQIFEGSRDDAALLEAASAHLLTIERSRTLTPGGLPVILHPLESGADASPLFDALIDVSSRRSYLLGLHEFSHGLADSGGMPDRAIAVGHKFIVSEPIFCGWHLLALEAIASAWRRAGNTQRALQFEENAKLFAERMLRILWSEELCLFVGYDHIAQRRLDTATLGGVIAAASANLIAAGIGARVTAAHLQGSSIFLGKAGIAFNPLRDARSYVEGMLWRGAVASGATQYWSYLVLKENGAHSSAQAAREQLEKLIELSGFREFYDATTGEGLGAGEPSGFTWPALVLDMR